jgi:hypothetical protein
MSQGVAVSLVTDDRLEAAASHGLNKMTEALKARGVAIDRTARGAEAKGSVVIVAGLAGAPGPAAQLLKEWKIDAPQGPEALVIRKGRWREKPALLVCGADARGLMYAALDVADRIGWAEKGADPLSEVRDAAEKPSVPERALSIYTMQRRYFEERLHNAAYWDRYFDMLARDRFNSFVVIFGYENGGYMAPAYPYFFDVEGFPDVRVVDLAKEDQRRNLEALNRLIGQAHARGINVTLGLWDHIYRAGVQTGGVKGADEATKRPVHGLVWGVTEQNLYDYNKAAVAKLIDLVPEVDALQFRMHDESGLKVGEQERFWHEIFTIIKQKRPELRFDARAKGLLDSVIEDGLAMGIHLRIPTKYWMEQMGLPFHPTHTNPQDQKNRRHSYADLLKYPQRYKMHWRLWNGGTARILLWGDPEYVRRFAASTHLYNGDGFEVNEPLCTKMEAQPHDQAPFALLREPYRYYEYEFERYWHFYQVFGRVGYNPDTPPEVWRKEFERRFGTAAAPHVEQGLHAASAVLPRVIASCYPYGLFPMTRGWAERQRLYDLPRYATIVPTDMQQFLSFDDEAACLIDGKESAKIRPEANSDWFANKAREILLLTRFAEDNIGDHRNKEFNSTMVDLKILAYLARYHSHRIRAGVSYCLFKRTQDLNAFYDARDEETQAYGAWRELVRAAGDVYTDDLMMGLRAADLAGHWKDELVALNRGLAELEKQRVAFKPADEPRIAHVPVRRVRPKQDLVIRATISGKDVITTARIAYGNAPGGYHYYEMKNTGGVLWQGVVPAEKVVNNWDYFIEAADAAGRPAVSSTVDRAHPITVYVSDDRQPPEVTHAPVASAGAGRPITISAKVSDASGVSWARVLYRAVNQSQDYRVALMQPGAQDTFTATIPAEEIDPKWDFMYLIEAMDTKGNGTIWPDLNRETPYVVVRLLR